MLRISARLVDGEWLLEDLGVPLPLENGTLAELTVRPSDVADYALRQALQRHAKCTLLPEGARLMSFVSTARVDSHIYRGLVVPRPPGGTNAGYVAMRVIEPLHLVVKPPRRPYLDNCDVWIDALVRTAGSINEAHTLISVKYETDRRSHTGNVFHRVLFEETTPQGGRWLPLERLRARAMAEFLTRTRAELEAESR
jgi:hypothetical protein